MPVVAENLKRGLPRDFSHQEVHGLIKEQLKPDVNRNSKHWQGSHEPVNDYGHSLLNLITMAKRRVGPKGKAYFDYGDWDSYLKGFHGEKYIGTKITDEELHLLVRTLLSNGTGEMAKHWELNTTPLTDGEIGLKQYRQSKPALSRKAIYALVKRRRVKVGDKMVGFFGAGSWAEYLNKRHKRNVRPKVQLQDAEIHEAIGSINWNGNDPNARFVQNSTIETESGYTLCSLYNMAKDRKGKNGLPFFDYGTWKNYMKRKQGIARWPNGRH